MHISKLSHLGSASIVQEEAEAIFEPEMMEDTKKTKVSKLIRSMHMYAQTCKQQTWAYMGLTRWGLRVEMRSGHMLLSLSNPEKISLIDKHF